MTRPPNRARNDLRALAAVCAAVAVVLALDSNAAPAPAWFAPACAAGAFLLALLTHRR